MRSVKVLVATLGVALAGCAAAPTGSSSGAAVATPRLGQPITEAQLVKWDIDVRTPDGRGLPPGKGSVADGKKVYDTACRACHATGDAGAPKFGDKAAWAPRLKTGMDALYTAALKGKAAMPAKGGNAALSDAEVKAGVDYMVAAAK